jgi:hypothetical protein
MLNSERLPDWLIQGNQLKCFQTDFDQMKYALEWDIGNLIFVKNELERIFTTVHKLPALNWLSYNTEIYLFESIEDLPDSLLEDWNDIDFLIELPTGQVMPSHWILDEKSWDIFLVAVTEDFIFKLTNDKIELVKKWQTELIRKRWDSPLSLSKLVLYSTRARFLLNSYQSSAHLNSILEHKDSLNLIELSFKQRAIKLAETWKQILEFPILTLFKLRQCSTFSNLDHLLESTTTESTENLFSYLRCVNIKVNNESSN